MDTISEIARSFGTQAEMAEAINGACPELNTTCTRAIVEKWVAANVIPSWWLTFVVRAAHSKGIDNVNSDLLAEISSHRLRETAA